VIPASFGQRLLWLKLEYEGWSPAFNCPIVCDIDGPLDRETLRSALGALYDRHEALRTTVVRQGTEVRQVVHAPRPISEDFRDLPDGSSAAEQLRDEIGKATINPAQQTSRVTLWRLADQRHRLCVNLHHLVTDTWSCMVLQRELPVLYAQHRGGGPSSLPAVGWQFGQFTAYQRRQLAGDGFQRHRKYWGTQLADACAPRLPLGPQMKGERMRAKVRHDIDAPTARILRALAVTHHVTLFTILLSIYKVVLRAITRQPDLTVATLFANRSRPELEHTVGFIANLVLLRSRLDGSSVFADIVSRVHATVVGGIAHQEFPIHTAPPRVSVHGSARLDRVVFQMLGERIDQAHEAGDVRFRWLVPDLGGRFDFELAVMPLENEGLGVKLDYLADAIGGAWADKFLRAYVGVAAAVARNEPLEEITADITRWFT
jgi:hypothetical protein